MPKTIPKGIFCDIWKQDSHQQLIASGSASADGRNLAELQALRFRLTDRADRHSAWYEFWSMRGIFHEWFRPFRICPKSLRKVRWNSEISWSSMSPDFRNFSSTLLESSAVTHEPKAMLSGISLAFDERLELSVFDCRSGWGNHADFFERERIRKRR
jgi:hypothetical protein